MGNRTDGVKWTYKAAKPSISLRTQMLSQPGPMRGPESGMAASGKPDGKHGDRERPGLVGSCHR